MIKGDCQLCGQLSELQDSHVWSKFAYKRYTTDQTHGGRFVDLFKGGFSNKQYTEPWFCRACEARFAEGPAGLLCDRIERNPHAIQEYDSELLRFATSISYRTMKFFNKDRSMRGLDAKYPAAKRWRFFLLDKVVGIKSFTQHVFLINDNPQKLDLMIGGRVTDKFGYVLSQIGPLLIVGHLLPELLTADERITWRNSQINREGGRIEPLSAWRMGHYAHLQNVTARFTAVLGIHEAQLAEQARVVRLN